MGRKIASLKKDAGAIAIGSIGGPIVLLISATIDPIPQAKHAGDALTVLVGFMVIWCVTFIPTLAISLPVQHLLRRGRMTGYLPAAGISTVCGAVILLLPTLIFMRSSLAPAQFSALGAAMGFVISSISWLIRRPDRDLPEEVLSTAS